VPNDPVLNSDASVQAWPVDGGNVLVTAATGLSFLEIYGEGDDVCKAWIEYSCENGQVQRHVSLSESELRARLPEQKRKGKMRVCIKSHGGGNLDIDDFSELRSKQSSFRLPNPIPGMGKLAFRGKKLGLSQMEGSQPCEFVFSSALQPRLMMTRIIFYHGFALDGIEFVYDDDSRQLFGKRGGKPGGDVFDLGMFTITLTAITGLNN
jgi:hypothetical protein